MTRRNTDRLSWLALPVAFAASCEVPAQRPVPPEHTTRAPTPQTIAVAADTNAGAPPGPAVEPCGLPPGSQRLRFEVAGVTRHATVTVGPRAKAPAPLVFAWHGFGASPDRFLQTLAVPHNWPASIVVTPEGLPRTFPDWFGDLSRPGWQIAAGELDDRDLRFFDVMMTELPLRYCVDRTRVYSTGFSNGAFFSNLLGCERGGDLAAIAPVAGGGPDTGRCPHAVPVRIAHGTGDQTVAFAFARQSARVWSAANGCAALGEDDVLGTIAGCRALPGCDTPVTFCSSRLGHRWPTGEAARIASFFATHTRTVER